MMLIEKEDLKRELSACRDIAKLFFKGTVANEMIEMIYGNVYDCVDDAKEIDPVKHGHWKMCGTAYECSVCHEGDPFGISDYCRWCGAKMDEVSE